MLDSSLNVKETTRVFGLVQHPALWRRARATDSQRVRLARKTSRAVAALAIGSLGLSACASHPVARPGAFPGAGGTAARVQAVITTALELRGTRYRLGGQRPDTGFDCSGFVRYVLEQHSVDVPRTVAEQYEAGRPVRRDQVRPGDLVFFSTIGPGPTHIGIVIGRSDQLEFIHAPGEGGRVRIERFDTAYWRTRWVGARRVL